MKPRRLLILIFILSACATKNKKSPHYQYGEFTDERDGHVYKTVKIGTQIWMAENLDYDFQNGTSIARSEYYDHNTGNGKLYGKLYNFDALLQGAIPKGWHLPSEAEWQQMEQSCTDPVKTLNILYAGEFGTGKFRYLGIKASFYTSTQQGNPIITRYVNKGDNSISTNRQGIGWELSVRCVKNAE